MLIEYFGVHLKSCSKGDIILYPSFQKSKYASSTLIQKLLCDVQDEQVRVLSSQDLRKRAHSLTVHVRSFIPITMDPKPIYINTRGLNYATYFWGCKYSFKAFVSLNILQVMLERLAECTWVFTGIVRWGSSILNKFEMNRETLAKSETYNFIKMRQNLSSCYMKTVRKEIKEQKDAFL